MSTMDPPAGDVPIDAYAADVARLRSPFLMRFNALFVRTTRSELDFIFFLGVLEGKLGLSVDLHGQLGEVLEHLGHLVAALAAADVDDALRVGVLRERLRDDRLAAAEGARHGARAAEHRGEEGVDDALAGEQRRVAGELLGDGARRALHRGRPPDAQAHADLWHDGRCAVRDAGGRAEVLAADPISAGVLCEED